MAEMRHVAAFMLHKLGGKDPTADDIEKVLSSVGIETDSSKLQLVMKELKGKNLEELLTSGLEKLAAVPSGGAVAPAAVGAVPAAEAVAVAAAPDKEEKRKEESEDEDEDMGFSLFD